MNNSITDLRTALFGQLERLSDPENNLEKEVLRAEAMVNVGRVIVDTAKTEVEFMKTTNSLGSGFIPMTLAAGTETTPKQLAASNNGSDKG